MNIHELSRVEVRNKKYRKTYEWTCKKCGYIGIRSKMKCPGCKKSQQEIKEAKKNRRVRYLHYDKLYG